MLSLRALFHTVQTSSQRKSMKRDFKFPVFDSMNKTPSTHRQQVHVNTNKKPKQCLEIGPGQFKIHFWLIYFGCLWMVNLIEVYNRIWITPDIMDIFRVNPKYFNSFNALWSGFSCNYADINYLVVFLDFWTQNVVVFNSKRKSLNSFCQLVKYQYE